MEDHLFGYASMASSVFLMPLVNANSSAMSSEVWNMTLGDFTRWQQGDDPQDGSAGVREPRRPSPAPISDGLTLQVPAPVTVL